LYGRELRLPKALFDEVTQGSGMFRNHGKMETTERDQNRSGGILKKQPSTETPLRIYGKVNGNQEWGR